VVPEGRWELSGFQSADADLYKLDCGEFRRHLMAMAESHRGPLATAPELLGHSPVHSPEGCPVLLTFDDGGASALLYVADMLDEFGWKAHFLVTAGRIGTPGFLNPSQIREMRQRGHIIGSHSYSHPTRMANCSTAQLDEEWQRSVVSLREILGEPIQVASVPGGYYSRKVAVTAGRAGIKLLFNSEPVTRSQTVEGCLVLGRFGAQRSTPPSWSANIVGDRGQARNREYLFWNAKKLAKAVLGTAWLRARLFLLARRAQTCSPPADTDSRP